MLKNFNYSLTARTVANKYPKFSFIGTQVNFWIIAFVLLFSIMYLNTRAAYSLLGIENNFPYWLNLLFAVVSGVLYGTALGFVDILIEKFQKKNLSLGRVLFMQFITYYLLIICLMFFSKLIIWEYIIVDYISEEVLANLTNTVWKFYYWIVLIYTLAMALVISFINQMNKKFGPGILVPMLLGRYRNPKEEQRVFMFMDLKSSTMYAEKLGHLKYSAMIRDSFIDINKVLAEYRAEVYQYVGDEIVVSWPQTEDFDGTNCIEFFFACKDQFNKRSEHYVNEYGDIPKFKAGVHQGMVTTVEVGDIKRDLAYHGDAINTTARIQEKCNEYESDILVSESFWEKVKMPMKFQKDFVGEVLLKGKESPVRLFSLQFSL